MDKRTNTDQLMREVSAFDLAKHAYPKTVHYAQSDWHLLPIMCSADNNEDRLVLTEFSLVEEPITHWDYTIILSEIRQQGGEA